MRLRGTLAALIVAIGLPAGASASPATGSLTLFPIESGRDATYFAAGLDGNLWATEFHPTALVARITPEGAVTEFPLSHFDALPRGIAAGPDGNLWVAEQHRDAIARVTTAGAITEFRLSRSHAGPFDIRA